MKNLKTLRNILTKTVIAFAAAAWMFAAMGTNAQAYPKTEGKVTVDTAKVRESASTSSGVKKTYDKGTTVVIVDEETDSTGTVWYKVTKDSVTGYIRSDLLEKGAVIESDASNDTPVDTSVDSQPVQTIPGVDPMPAQYAEISVDSGKMRADASTGDSIVTTLKRGTQIIVSGSKSGSDGKLWYYATTTDGSTGFIRNDLVTLGDLLPQDEQPATEEPASEETTAEEPASEPYVNNDYEVVYTDDGTGQDVWYLYDHMNNNRVKLEELLKYVDQEVQNGSDAEKTIKTQKVVMIILAIFLLIAVVAIVIMAIKLRDSYYENYGDDYEEDDEEEDDEDEEEDERPVRRRPAPEPEPVRERRPQRQMAPEYGTADEGVRRRTEAEKRQERQERSSERRSRETNYSDSRQSGETRKPAQRKTRNFMIDADEDEFEFLNLDDDN